MIGGGIADTEQTCTEEFDGLSWSVRASLINARFANAGVGTVNDVVTYRGDSPGTVGTYNENFDGTAWHRGSGMSPTGAYPGGRGSSAGSMWAAGMASATPLGNQMWVFEEHYPTSASFKYITPSGTGSMSINTDTFSLKGKYVNDENTVFLLHSDTVHGSVDFSGSMGDSSYTASLGTYHSMSLGGNVHHSTGSSVSQSAKFGNTSIAFDGVGDYIDVWGAASVPGTGSTDFNFGSGSFTVEAWINISGSAANEAEGDVEKAEQIKKLLIKIILSFFAVFFIPKVLIFLKVLG